MSHISILTVKIYGNTISINICVRIFIWQFLTSQGKNLWEKENNGAIKLISSSTKSSCDHSAENEVLVFIQRIFLALVLF